MRLTVWWRPKAGAIISLLLFYLALWDVPFSEGWKLLLFSVITLTGFGLTGYFLNDWADIPFDRKVGKTNLVEGISRLFRPLIFIGLLAITLFPWFVYFEMDKWSIGLICLQFFLQFAYPVPPIRLKNYPVLAIITDSMYAFVVPTSLAWHTFDLTSGMNDNAGQLLHFCGLGVWMLAMGGRHIINHHVVDKENDRLTGTPNLALRISVLSIRRFYQNILFPIELLSSVLFFTVLLQYSGLLPVVFLIALILIGSRAILRSGPFFSVTFTKLPIDNFVSFQMGFISLLVLAVLEPFYLSILFLFLVLFSDLFNRSIRAIVFWRWPWQQLSLVVNWGIYYFRKWFLGWPEERNWGVHYPKRLKELAEQELSKNGTVAVFNQNLEKYSETFVNGQIKALNYRVLYYSGWPKPLYLQGSGLLIDSTSLITTLKFALMNAFGKDIGAYQDDVIVKSLVEHEVSCIVAHFGPMGAKLLHVAKISGIPLVTVFHGYDAWNKVELEAHKEGYKELFDQSVLVVGVSKQICARLEELGCPSNKIEYMPAYVNPVYFETKFEYHAAPEFLSVGRFSCTKSPFLVIESFCDVLKQIPEARLTMIGGDDGEGLYEACHILVRALGIEHKVRFLGILPPERVLEEMKATTIFVQHSVTTPLNGDKEGTPVSIMEAMALGLPIVATDHAGIGEMITNGKTGILVDEFGIDQMSKEMIRLATDIELRKELGGNAAAEIRNNELVSDGARKFAALIERYRSSK